MSEQAARKKHNPYEGMRVHLRRLRHGSSQWHLYAVHEDEIVSSTTMVDVDEATALERATTLAGWFDAELVVEKIGVS